MHVGFIGTGSMGTILIEAFIDARTVLPEYIHASNRTFAKVDQLARKYEGLHAYETNTAVAKRAHTLFLCIKPLEFNEVLQEINPYLTDEHLLISITSPVAVTHLEHLCTSKVAKIIPSITNAARKGASLMVAGTRLTEQDKEILYQLMRTISEPVWIDEQYSRVSSDIVSCGPAFLSCLLQEMIAAAERETGLPQEQASQLISHMLVGFGELLNQNKFSLVDLQKKVSVPGGVTGEGIKILNQEMGNMFDLLFQKTHAKHREDQKQIEDIFNLYS